MARFAHWSSPERVKTRLQAQLYHARERRRELRAAQQAEEQNGDPGIFSEDFSEDFE